MHHHFKEAEEGSTTQQKENGKPPLCTNLRHFNPIVEPIELGYKFVTLFVVFHVKFFQRENGSTTPKEGGESRTTQRKRMRKQHHPLEERKKAATPNTGARETTTLLDLTLLLSYLNLMQFDFDTF